jgi:serine/threonine protein kinase/Tol biopolymer transport system component
VIAQNDWHKVREVFHGALEREPDDRAAFLREACGGDDQVHHEVASLLAAHDNAEGFLSGPATPAPDSSDYAPLSPGSNVGPFEIVELAGRGGMGEVYRARDTRLDRSVAIKFLTPALADNPKGRERFEREARAISKLAHPHICTLLDIGSGIVRGVEARYLVMEFVEGETVAARLRRGPMPAAEALSAGAQIADALAAAHAVGVIHRDLKPGNIMLTRSGAKLLDFGLARFAADGAGRTAGPSSSDEPLTNDGAIVGTLAYMAPEQLRGLDVDARSDVFSFGAVLYEMLSGTRAFDGNSNADIIAAVLEHQPPPLADRSPLTPRALDRLVSTCLAKDPHDRWQSSRDLQRELRWLLEDKTSRVEAPVRVHGARRARTLNWVAATVAAALAAVVYLLLLSRQAPAQPLITFPVAAPPDTTFSRGTAQMSVSPDGSMLAFVAASNNGTRRLWIRRFSDLEPWVLDETVNALYPFWSPDSRSVGFFAADKLLRIDVDGGGRRELSAVLMPRGGTWNRDGTILFGSNFLLQRVPNTGGVPTPVMSLGGAERAHSWPLFLPDGRRFLYLALAKNSSDTAIYVGDLDASSRQRVLTTNASFALAGNQLFTLIKRTLVAQEFDVNRGQVLGQPRELFDRIGVDVRNSQAAFSAAGGVLTYRRVGDQSHLTWFDRRGNTLESFRETADFHHASLAPDGRRVAIEKTDPASGRHTIWILDFDRGTSSRLINDATGAHGPVWSPDGGSVLFGSNRFGALDLFTMPADGSGTEALRLRDPIMHRSVDWSKDGRLMLCEIGSEGQQDLWIVPVSAPQQKSAFLDSRADELQGQFSPDGKWIAYTSNESGSHEVYVRRFPERDAKWRVSIGGGAQPRWRGDGAELFYLAPDGALMAADVKRSGLALETSKPYALFNTGIRGMFVDRRNHYVVTQDGQRFLVNQMGDDDTTAPITVSTNWR